MKQNYQLQQLANDWYNSLSDEETDKIFGLNLITDYVILYEFIQFNLKDNKLIAISQTGKEYIPTYLYFLHKGKNKHEITAENLLLFLKKTYDNEKCFFLKDMLDANTSLDKWIIPEYVFIQKLILNNIVLWEEK